MRSSRGRLPHVPASLEGPGRPAARGRWVTGPGTPLPWFRVQQPHLDPKRHPRAATREVGRTGRMRMTRTGGDEGDGRSWRRNAICHASREMSRHCHLATRPAARHSRYLPGPDSDGNPLAPPSRMVLGTRVAAPGEVPSIQREVTPLALALTLTLTGIGRPLNATLAPAPAVAVAEVATKRTSRGGATPASRLEREARPGSGRHAVGAEHSRPGGA